MIGPVKPLGATGILNQKRGAVQAVHWKVMEDVGAYVRTQGRGYVLWLRNGGYVKLG